MATTISIVEPAPYIHGQTIHVVTEGVHGHAYPEMFGTQESQPTQYIYWVVNPPGGVYELDSPTWNPAEIAHMRLQVWDGVKGGGGVIEAEMDFDVRPSA